MISATHQGLNPAEGWARWLDDLRGRLICHFGPRHWWPGTGDKPRATPFEMIVGAILVQNVSWKNAEHALTALAEAGLLEPRALGLAPAAAVEELIRPTGYFRQKRIKLKRFLEHLDRHYGGGLESLLAQPCEALRQELLTLWGIGPETCDCILNYAAGHPVMPMDAYTRRIMHRLGAVSAEATYTELQAFFHAHTPAETELRGEFHAQLDTLGNRICLKRRPLCGECPLSEICPRVGVEAVS